MPAFYNGCHTQAGKNAGDSFAGRNRDDSNMPWFDRSEADLLIAGGRNLYTGLKARIPFLDVNQEREFAFAGYAGMIELAERIVRSIQSPIWGAVRSKAPWEGV